MTDDTRPTTDGEDYARRLQAKQDARWKKILNVQAPYRWNLRRQHLGRTLDLGSGIGRNLFALAPGSVGVDHNAASVAAARRNGLTSFTPDEFFATQKENPATFDGLLMAHVVEHMELPEAEQLLRLYLPYVKPGGRVFFVVPQERGYDSDPTHVRFAIGEDLVALATAVGLEPGAPFSFPFPRAAGKAFIYNETCLLSEVPAAGIPVTLPPDNSAATGIPTSPSIDLRGIHSPVTNQVPPS